MNGSTPGSANLVPANLLIRRSAPEPYSIATLRDGADPEVVQADAHRILALELERYVRGDVGARSVFLGAERGQGKTTAVLAAILEQRRRSRAARERPPGNRRHRVILGETMPAVPYPVFVQAPTLLPELVGPDAVEQDWDLPFPSTAGSVSTFKSFDASDALHRRVLSATLRALIDATIDEMIGWFRDAGKVEQASALDVVIRYGAPSETELAGIWQSAGRLGPGIVPWPVVEPKGEGLFEVAMMHALVTLRSILHGKVESSTKARAAGSSQTYELKFDVDKLLPALLGTGGVVGLSMAHDPASMALVLGGLLVATAALKLWNRSPRRGALSIVDLSYAPDGASLVSEIRPLVDRINRMGLAPVLVIDEVDKLRATALRWLPETMKGVWAGAIPTYFLGSGRQLDGLERRAGSGHPDQQSYSIYSRLLRLGYPAVDLHAYVAGKYRIDTDLGESDLAPWLAGGRP